MSCCSCSVEFTVGRDQVGDVEVETYFENGRFNTAAKHREVWLRNDYEEWPSLIDAIKGHKQTVKRVRKEQEST